MDLDRPGSSPQPRKRHPSPLAHYTAQLTLRRMSESETATPRDARRRLRRTHIRLPIETATTHLHTRRAAPRRRNAMTSPRREGAKPRRRHHHPGRARVGNSLQGRRRGHSREDVKGHLRNLGFSGNLRARAARIERGRETRKTQPKNLRLHRSLVACPWRFGISRTGKGFVLR